jgi:Zn-dependent peptidase ImmA (M78 family)/transcriptional regulator with XRE-family HTH domain
MTGEPPPQESPRPSPSTSIGELIRQQRGVAGLTQRQLGELVGTSYTHISKVEAGKELPSADLVRQIAQALEGNTEEFLLLAGRVPEELGDVVIEKQDLAPRFLRSWREGQITDAAVEQLLQSGVRNTPVFPRSLERHEQRAAQVLTSYSMKTGWAGSLPIPVEHILESMGLHILWEELEEPLGERILGALDPATSTIYMNQRHLNLFGDVIGPQAFTLGHELGHWLYDAENPAQLTFGEGGGGRVLCRGLRQIRLEDRARIREVNANQFAACLLLPRDMVAASISAPIPTLAALKAIANAWGVSRQALEIRLSQAGLAHLLPVLG